MRARVAGLVSVILALLGALVWATAVAAAPGTTGVVCGPAQAKTLTADNSARVYSRGGNVFGCSRSAHQSFRLGSMAHSMSEGRAGPIALAGVDVAYGLTYYGVDTISADVVVRSLTDGDVLRRQSSYAGTVGPEYFQTVDDIVVKRDGSVAWIATAGSIISPHSTNIEVEKSDRSRETLLARSQQIKVHSLRLHHSRLRWREGQATRRATLK